MHSLSLTSRVKVTPEQVSSELGQEVVILHVKNGVYYGLDEVGVVIWKALQQGCQVAEIIARVMGEFDVDQAKCEQDVLRILGELVDAQLVSVEAA
ncbi:MAG: PqqD family peptide modification chaperone [Terriglobales bacterium]